MEDRTVSSPALVGERHNVLDAYQGLPMEKRLAIVGADKLAFSICLLNVTGDINISQTLRSASLLGAEKALVVGRRRFDGRGSVGVQHYLPIEKIEARVVGDEEAIDEEWVMQILAERQLFPVGIETGGRPLSKDIWSEVLSGPGQPCLVFGNEGMGLPPGLRTRMPLISIPQRGVMRSFNVSAAASIVMWHLADYLAASR